MRPVPAAQELVIEPSEEPLACGVVGAALFGRYAPDEAVVLAGRDSSGPAIMSAAVGVDRRAASGAPLRENSLGAGLHEPGRVQGGQSAGRGRPLEGGAAGAGRPAQAETRRQKATLATWVIGWRARPGQRVVRATCTKSGADGGRPAPTCPETVPAEQEAALVPPKSTSRGFENWRMVCAYRDSRTCPAEPALGLTINCGFQSRYLPRTASSTSLINNFRMSPFCRPPFCPMSFLNWMIIASWARRSS